MKSSFRFANVCGTVYQQGNIQFTGNGDCLYSPVGNRLSVFDLVRNVSFTLPFETRKPIARVAISPANTSLVLVADEDGHALLIKRTPTCPSCTHEFQAPCPRRAILARWPISWGYTRHTSPSMAHTQCIGPGICAIRASPHICWSL